MEKYVYLYYILLVMINGVMKQLQKDGVQFIL